MGLSASAKVTTLLVGAGSSAGLSFRSRCATTILQSSFDDAEELQDLRLAAPANAVQRRIDFVMGNIVSRASIGSDLVKDRSRQLT